MDTNQDGRIDSEDLHNALAKVKIRYFLYCINSLLYPNLLIFWASSFNAGWRCHRGIRDAGAFPCVRHWWYWSNRLRRVHCSNAWLKSRRKEDRSGEKVIFLVVLTLFLLDTSLYWKLAVFRSARALKSWIRMVMDSSALKTWSRSCLVVHPLSLPGKWWRKLTRTTTAKSIITSSVKWCNPDLYYDIVWCLNLYSFWV